MTVINLTPHTVVILDTDNAVIASYPSQGIARVSTNKQVVGEVDGVNIKSVEYGAIDGLPEYADENVLYIVSMVVAQAASGRADLISPDTAPDSTVRDNNGQIIGVRNFARY